MIKINEHQGKEVQINDNTTLDEIRQLIEKDDNEKSVWITLKNGYFTSEIYDYFCCNQYEINITKDQSIARKRRKKVELPIFPNYTVGSGGIVYNKEKDEILMIKQTYGPKTFKFPGGYSNKKEKPLETAIREIKEEVGVDTTPLSEQPVMVFSSVKDDHLLGSHVDLYFVYLLTSKCFDITIDKNEILDYKWVKLDEYLKMENLSFIQKEIQKNLIKFF